MRTRTHRHCSLCTSIASAEHFVNCGFAVSLDYSLCNAFEHSGHGLPGEGLQGSVLRGERAQDRLGVYRECPVGNPSEGRTAKISHCQMPPSPWSRTGLDVYREILSGAKTKVSHFFTSVRETLAGRRRRSVVSLSS